ncbi:hypothetical protein Nepgr_022695 [Nepenthes gracilis]|uniref:Cytochrome b561 and DOMON domain-containing protein n=1 Tax=Nepenthes gracilis TaxID=150966 RepID=A0AAD3SZJ7_NEPGR|nr:hypothetical protein Nepgr_022695 [Nepenthes gracilis]
MKNRRPFIFIAIFVVIFNPNYLSSVKSQSTDSCSSNVNFNDFVPFDTASLLCNSVWPSQGYVLRYARAGTGLWSFLLSAPDPNSYVAIGFSNNGLMVGSSAMVGWIQSGSGLIKQYYLGGLNPSAVTPDQGDLTVVDNSSVAFGQSSRIFLAFQLSASQPSNHLIYAVGPSGFQPSSPGYLLMQHSTVVSTTLDYTTGESQAQSSSYRGIKRTHGAMSMVAWGILIPIGVMVARYFRGWDPIWFYAHATIQVIAFTFGLIGVILGLIVYDLLSSHVTTHKGIGMFVLGLGCLQMMAILARPEKGTKWRKYWNWCHYFTGRMLMIFAVANAFYGIHLGMEGPSWTDAYAATLAVLFIAAVLLEFKMRSQI